MHRAAVSLMVMMRSVAALSAVTLSRAPPLITKLPASAEAAPMALLLPPTLMLLTVSVPALTTVGPV